MSIFRRSKYNDVMSLCRRMNMLGRVETELV